MPTNKLLVAFQKELMSRLQNLGKAGDIANWLAIETAGLRYLLPLEEAGGVALLSSVGEVEPVAHTKAWFVGIVSIHGVPFAMIDFAGWLGLRVGSPDLTYMARHNASLITFNPKLDINCALLVDAILGLKNSNDFTKKEASENAALEEYYLDKEGQTWQMMRLSDLVRDEYFLYIEDV